MVRHVLQTERGLADRKYYRPLLLTVCMHLRRLNVAISCKLVIWTFARCFTNCSTLYTRTWCKSCLYIVADHCINKTNIFIKVDPLKLFLLFIIVFYIMLFCYSSRCSFALRVRFVISVALMMNHRLSSLRPIVGVKRAKEEILSRQKLK